VGRLLLLLDWSHPGNLAAQGRSAESHSRLSEGNFLFPGIEKPTLQLEHAELALIGEPPLRVTQEEPYRDRELVHGVSRLMSAAAIRPPINDIRNSAVMHEDAKLAVVTQNDNQRQSYRTWPATGKKDGPRAFELRECSRSPSNSLLPDAPDRRRQMRGALGDIRSATGRSRATQRSRAT
jgi:hypothetical protein